MWAQYQFALGATGCGLGFGDISSTSCTAAQPLRCVRQCVALPACILRRPHRRTQPPWVLLVPVTISQWVLHLHLQVTKVISQLVLHMDFAQILSSGRRDLSSFTLVVPGSMCAEVGIHRLSWVAQIEGRLEGRSDHKSGAGLAVRSRNHVQAYNAIAASVRGMLCRRRAVDKVCSDQWHNA